MSSKGIGFVLATVLSTLSISVRAATPTASGTADVAGRHYAINGPAECHQSDAASIYNVPTAMWSVSMNGSGANSLSRLNVTVWQPTRGGAPQVTLSIVAGSASYEIVTTTGAPGKGSATAKTERKGSGGTLTVDGRTAAGQPIALTVSCSAFTPPEDNG